MFTVNCEIVRKSRLVVRMDDGDGEEAPMGTALQDFLGWNSIVKSDLFNIARNWPDARSNGWDDTIQNLKNPMRGKVFASRQ